MGQAGQLSVDNRPSVQGTSPDQATQLNFYSYVTGSGKSLHLRTKSEFNFIAQDSSYTSTNDLSIHSVSTVQC